MKKKITLTLLVIVLTTTIFTTKVFTYNIGAYAGYSGAPNDYTCDVPGCHSSYNLNSGAGSVVTTLTDSNGVSVQTYHPGSTYNVNVTVSYTGRSTFGFETTVRKLIGNSQIGTLTPGTGVQYCPYPQTVNYITHEYSSISGSNSRTWISTWTAPGSNAGEIVFYTAGNAANGDGTVDSDYIYTTKLRLTYSASAGIAEPLIVHYLQVYPNPCTDLLHASYTLQEPAQIGISILDLQGRIVKNITNQTTPAGEQQIETSINDLANGIYILKIRTGGQDSYSKIIKE